MRIDFNCSSVESLVSILVGLGACEGVLPWDEVKEGFIKAGSVLQRMVVIMQVQRLPPT